jgi:hypothetical protein
VKSHLSKYIGKESLWGPHMRHPPPSTKHENQVA